MQHGWAVIAVALVYFGLLFALAAYADRVRPAWMSGWGRPYIYSFSIAVYCTSWTFFGSVGLATTSGLDFIGIYIGPIIAFTVASPILLKVTRLARAQNITSVADFMAARYGKNQTLAVIVSVAALVGAVPYIALQLKAISTSVITVLTVYGASSAPAYDAGAIALWVALILAVFSSLFGTRHVNATEHQSGLMLAIAAESFIKLIAFFAVGIFVTWVMFDGIGDLVRRAEEANLVARFDDSPHMATLITFSVLSFFCAFLLPRQFHVTIVENMGEKEIRHAAWLVPLYMIAINIFVVPMALAGMLMFGDGPVTPDMYVLNLPMMVDSHLFALAAFVGGLSAATAMVIVESVALAIMMSNNIALPLLLRSHERGLGDMPRFLLLVRRASIFLILIFAYVYYRNTSEVGLAQIGLLSFAAIAQFAPAFFGGLFWRRASGTGAIVGTLTGLVVWAYTLLLPSIAHDGMVASQILEGGLFGIDFLMPLELFGLKADPLVHGVFWSLVLNTIAYILGSLVTSHSPMERLQANIFVGDNLESMASSFRGWHSPVRVGELQSAVARYIGEERTQAAFEQFATARNARPALYDEADIHLVRYAEHLLASVIGTSSSRLVLSLLLRRGAMSRKAAMRLLDEASVAVQHSRDVLQTALDHARHGVAVFDSSLRLVCWNREYVNLFGHADDFLRVGKPLEEILRSNAERGLYGPGRIDDIVAERMQNTAHHRTFRSTLQNSGKVVEIRIDNMPDGGLVATFTDVTETVTTEKALEARVNERTRELTHLNQELARAKAEADSANYSKTRFLAAASHDILQPLNAARLYVSSLVERSDGSASRDLVANVDASLQSVEEIFSVLLDISRLDAGALTPDISIFKLGDVMRQLEVEFAPLAREKGLSLKIIHTQGWVRSDRRMLRRLLQNLVSNAIKYTQAGTVLMGVRRMGGRLRVEVWDTGLGIPASSQRVIFKEFQRLEPGARVARGLGLGLSIVERVARILDHPLTLKSTPGKGSTFSVVVPAAPAQRAVPTETAGLSPFAPSMLARTHILCIDNEPAILDGMTQLLGGWGCKVTAAASLADALVSLDSDGSPDIIIADYHLDGGDGLSTIRELRMRIGGEIPGIVVTADRGRAVRDGARAQDLEILHKPVRPAALRALLAQMRVARPAAE
ncbi:histidine kinase [Terrihabitans soli]|uniref:histidine kinase n=1 Tax=Terrihabitans soli TaxID=708113 RepID=A0A6S6QN07_9HYPH|nr:PAS domain-containing hybrid sensor histidine kinase/response regulator [Terrihabitans soli]BCJ91884.1 histidine kinase [Terrihabitans soli]